VIVRATAVELLGELPPEQIRFGDFEDSFRLALEDEKLNDALLATIEAIGKQKTERAADFLKDRLYYLSKLNPKYGTSKYLARRRIIALLKEKSASDFSDKLGKTDSIFTLADYVRAVSRRNARAILTTDKGSFTIEFAPQDAPLTVDNFIKLARGNYFNGTLIHRVVPNFVVQDGDPRGDGNGGPGWEIRDEINMIAYERGAIGMALSGKDTGGSQWFVTHSPQPHLDGGYTVFGRVNESDMKIVDNLVRGDKILSVKIIENNLTAPKTNNKRKSKTK
jgi:cyclophilin family peptidyl-prolyl cis-trans isomerase